MPTWPDDPYDALDEMVARFGVRIVKTWFTTIEDRHKVDDLKTVDREPEPELPPIITGWDDGGWEPNPYATLD
jgi:hypothetical protein